MHRIFLTCFVFLCHFFIHSEIEIDDETFLEKAIEEVEDTKYMVDLKGCPNATVGNCVNAITGSFSDGRVDMEVRGSNPITLARSFNSSMRDRGSLCHAWNINLPGKVTAYHSEDENRNVIDRVTLLKHGSSEFAFEGIKDSSKVPSKQLHHGVTNCSSGILTAKNNIKNLRFKSKKKSDKCSLKLSEFENLKFNKFHSKDNEIDYSLSMHNFPNRCSLKYNYDKSDRLKSILSTGSHEKEMGSLRWLYPYDFEKTPMVTIQSDDGREIIYQFKKMQSKDSDSSYRYCLSEVISEHIPHQKYKYEFLSKKKPDLLKKISLPDGRFKKISYYRYKTKNYVFETPNFISDKKDSRVGRVRILSAPVGYDKSAIPTYTFDYHTGHKHATEKPEKGYTDVYDAYKNKIRYIYDRQHRLDAIISYSKDGSVYRKEQMKWGAKDHDEYTCLLERTLLDGNNQKCFSRKYKYDKKGNVLQETVVGNLSGQGEKEVYVKQFTYTPANQIATEDDGFRIIKYDYYPDSDLIKRRWIISNSQICERYFYDYDANGSMISEIIDDGLDKNINNLTGVTQRFIKKIVPARNGLPKVIEEKVFDFKQHKEVLAKKLVNHYSHSGQLVKQEVYDADLNHIYSKEVGYDVQENVIWEINELGQQTSYGYDANKNRIFKQGPIAEYYNTYAYDYSNRLIREEEVHTDGKRYVKTYTYDYLGNRTSSTDYSGNITRYKYDEFNRIIETIYPTVIRPDETSYTSSEKVTYDVLNNINSRIDGNGQLTKYRFSSYGKAATLENPDGTIEKNIYRPDGVIQKTIMANGTSIEYEYDYKDRKTVEKRFSALRELLSIRTWTYNAFQLLSETDCNGNTTYFSYNSAGQLVKAKKGENETGYVYDSRGRKVEIWDKCQNNYFRKNICQYDNRNQVIEERIEDNFGNMLSLKCYSYDIHGNRTHTSTQSSNGLITKVIEYDTNKQVTKITHPNGEVTQFHRTYDHSDPWGNTVCYEIEIDPMGTHTCRTYNPVGKIAMEEHKSPLGDVLRRSTFCYDGNGNVIRKYEDLIIEGEIEKTILTKFEWDALNREVGIFEAYGTSEQKITRKEYNALGKISRIYKADGIIVDNLYDPQGRLTDLCDSKGEVHYRYTYDSNDNIFSVLDLKNDRQTIREYDFDDRVICEIMDSGLKQSYEYDAIGRITKIILPDQSEIVYEYDAKNLLKISRGDYEVSYNYDISGKIQSISLPHNHGEITYDYDCAMRLINIASPYYSQVIPEGGYDGCNRLLKSNQTDSIGTVNLVYDYDFLHQLISEKGDVSHLYAYDSRFNRIKKDDTDYENNALNQLLSQGSTSYVYDKNGNQRSISREGKKIDCTYDALDRLITVEIGETRVKFVYDAFHRRMSKAVFEKVDGNWTEIYFEQYLYLFDTEFGAVNAEGKIVQLNMIGPGVESNSAAIELQGHLFIPFHDHRGNVVSLVEGTTGAVVETHRYTAYGEETVYDADGEKVDVSENPWRFSGKRLDAEIGLSYFGRRYYDSEVGKWTTPDPLWFEDGPNLYAYVHNSPILYMDPNGLFSIGPLNFTNGNFTVSFNYFEKVADFVTNAGRFIVGQPLVDTCTHEYCVSGKKYDNLSLTFMNGIWNTPEEARDSAKKFSMMAGGIQVRGIYNGSQGVFDLFEAMLNLGRVSTEPVSALKAMWMDAFSKMGPDGKILHSCHSQGSILTRLALLEMEPHLRERIHIIALCPAEYIEKELCGSVIHICSKNDPVTRIDVLGQIRCRDTIIWLDRHPDASWFDHFIDSPTFTNKLTEVMDKSLQKLGGA